MKFRKQKAERWSNSETYKGKSKGYIVELNFSGNPLATHSGEWYFMISNEATDFRFNSLWKFKGFVTMEQCEAKAVEYLEELLKQIN